MFIFIKLYNFILLIFFKTITIINIFINLLIVINIRGIMTVDKDKIRLEINELSSNYYSDN